MKTFGQRIRELREEQDVSLREFAKKLGLSAAFLSDVELGRRHPSSKVLADMSRALKTTVAELQSFDSRPPMDDLRRMADVNPKFGLAFRLVRDKEISPEDLIALANKKPNRK
jgi:transcriptional regulator with XRE-family HTH domain